MDGSGHRRNNIRSCYTFSISRPSSAVMRGFGEETPRSDGSTSSDPSWSSSSRYTPSKAHSTDLLDGNRDGSHEYGAEGVENGFQHLSAGPIVDGFWIPRLVSSCKSRVLAVVLGTRDRRG